MAERPLSHVPRPALAALVLILALQLLTGWLRPLPRGQAEGLHPPPSLPALQLLSFGNPVAFSRLLMLRLQSADGQSGVKLALADLDYGQVEGWLARALELDPRAQYPLFLAVRVYGSVADRAKARQMLDFAYRQFLLDPDRRWRWTAESATWLWHRLGDPKQARGYAQALRERATGPEVPAWARQMEIFILEGMDETESARVLVGGLISSGQVKDANELRFLAGEMERLARKPDSPQL